METFLPRPELRDRVASIELVASPGHAVQVLPSSSAVLGLQLHGSVRAERGPLSPLGVTGIQAQSRHYTYEGPTASLLVRFTPQGAACLGVPVSELSGLSTPLDGLWSPRRIADVVESVREATRTADKVGALEAFLLELPFSSDPLVTRALRLLESSEEEGASVHAVARQLAVSERQLERRFLARVGVSPKRYARLRRFERAQKLLTTTPSLTAVAAAAGYADQSHFIREFREFSGKTPTALRDDRRALPWA